jgi:hypothetical protein
MIIRILGSGCNARENTRQTLSDLGVQAEVLKVTDFAETAAHGGTSTPALAIDDKAVSLAEVAAFLQAR